jgi:hypothetical protein
MASEPRLLEHFWIIRVAETIWPVWLSRRNLKGLLAKILGDNLPEKQQA